MAKSRKQHPYYSFKAAKLLADVIDKKYGGRVDAAGVQEYIKMLEEFHDLYGDEMPVSLLSKEELRGLLEKGYVEPIYKKKPS